MGAKWKYKKFLSSVHAGFGAFCGPYFNLCLVSLDKSCEPKHIR